MLNYTIALLVSLSATIIGAICGVGGGIIIKPILDACGIFNAASASFLSGCTVLAMTIYSVIKSKLDGNSKIETRTSTALAFGSVIGGIVGKNIFQYVWITFTLKNKVSMIQAISLIVVTLGTLLYTLYKKKIKTHHVKNLIVTAALGLVLGIISSFLGIGGGPLNLVVLYFFFSMETKTAAENSLYIILFSQSASLVTYFVTKTVPGVSAVMLILMICGGIVGGIAGRRINKKISSASVDKLFICLLSVIVVLNFLNTFRFAGLISL